MQSTNLMLVNMLNCCKNSVISKHIIIVNSLCKFASKESVKDGEKWEEEYNVRNYNLQALKQIISLALISKYCLRFPSGATSMISNFRSVGSTQLFFF